jgi:Domain of unknown function (DUF4385)
MAFPYHLNFKTTDFRKNPDLYRVGIGEQGVLLVEPYKSEILPHWKFKDEAVATIASQKIYSLFIEYLKNNDFVGADMARKYLQMGFTRARRYANHPGGKKYKSGNTNKSENLEYPYSSGSKNKGNAILPQNLDWATNEKARVANIYKSVLDEAKNNPEYIKQKKEFIKKYGTKYKKFS